MLSLAWAQTRAHPARLAAVLLAIVLGTLFLAATAVFSATSDAGMRAVAAAPLAAADVVVDRDPESTDPGPDWTDMVADHPDIGAVTAYHARTVRLATGERRGEANVYSFADEPELRWFDLAEGVWPTAPDEVVADTATLDALGLSVGDTVRILPREGEGTRATVVGATAPGFQPLTGVQYTLYATEAHFEGDSAFSVLADTADGVSAPEAVANLGAALPEILHPVTAEEQARLAADRFAGGSQQLGMILLVFALIALLAASAVIANTFTILLSQRRRDTALLRLVGADRARVRNLVVAEALIVGTVGSLIGVCAGVGVGYAGASLAGLDGGGPEVRLAALFGAFLVGVVTTVGAAWFPARRAAVTAPVEALRSVPLQGGVRLRPVHVLGTAAALLGAAAMAAGVAEQTLPLAVGGGSVGALGLLLTLRYLIARLLGAVEPLLRRMGGAPELAGANLRRDPGRAATATLALVLGLGLICALTTAAATGRATIDSDLRDRYPVEVSARVDEGSVAPETVAAVRAVNGLELVEVPRTERVTVAGLDEVTLVGVSAELVAATGAGELAEAVNTPVMLVSGAQLKELGAEAGETVELTVDGSRRSFTVYPSHLATASGTPAPVVRADVLDTVAEGGEHGMVWGVAAPEADTDDLAAQMSLVAGADPDIALSGALSERADITEVLDVMVDLALMMLLVTVVISSVGVANTLGLSVLERTRELALLRALGLTRGGLRGTLAVEAVVIALLGAVLGVLVGVPYGVVGVDAIVGGTAPLVVAVPWGRLGLVLVAALVIGAVATLLPARRAARIAPAEGLSGD
ncbi:ABC transporter permease [Nocardiopsis terrae]|uniref:ABC transport system permease protein n=1 Tax=Nocardiopsis terrae TaxID=372655 RepID=A0ABR9HKH6_9ACTN|nr:FtsX-like permease family protein [Nocardiopsis terrae]MBE1459515.1 putative ABC transport system permease protein [Nocardiopsis terrae]GHC95250.1 ABC transporter permease [Nocardiopsis terrae]